MVNWRHLLTPCQSVDFPDVQSAGLRKISRYHQREFLILGLEGHREPGTEDISARDPVINPVKHVVETGARFRWVIYTMKATLTFRNDCVD